MQVFDEVTKCWVDARLCKKIMIEHQSNLIIYGYTSRPERTVRVFAEISNNRVYHITDPKLFKSTLYFSKLSGCYFSPINMSNDEIIHEILLKGCGSFPYLLERRYEAIENFSNFKDKQIIKDTETEYQLSNYLNYSFGLEFETSQGYIPEDVCYKDGLIPLRDGSISGVEYSTVVLDGNEGISLLHQQLETLKEYTSFNKECSLHIHFGKYPLNSEKIFNLYTTCKGIESELEKILPKYTFHSSYYKDNEKDYCKKLPLYFCFNNMYESIVGRRFFGDFTQPHPCDVERRRKWNIDPRYVWCNFVNALCYNVNKTIEFRFLRPTYNFKKIILWLYLFNGILEYSERYFNSKDKITLSLIIDKCYPYNIAKELKSGINKLYALTYNQMMNGDKIGAEVWMEEQLFNNLSI